MEIIKQEALINGQFIKIGADIQAIDVISPVNLQVIGQVPALTVEQINKAFDSAKAAQKDWEQLGLKKRVAILEVWKQKIIDNMESLAQLMVLEIAKPLKAALAEIKRTIVYFEATIQEAYRLKADFYTGVVDDAPNKWGVFQRKAKGVVLAIAPFNYPVNLSLAKIVPALVTGNTVVFKPASQGALTGLFLAQLAAEANLPPGVFNAVSGKGSEIGDVLVTNSHLNVISFTGSTAVGNHLATMTQRVDLVMELGGKDAALVLDDCDLELTAQKIIAGAFNYSGQRCTALKRVLVSDATATRLIPLLKKYSESLSVGSPLDDCDITPLVDFKAVPMLKEMIATALSNNATLVTGNKWKDNLLTPTILDHVTTEMAIANVEPFAPILPIIRVGSVKEAITINNASNYGLQASIFTNNIDLAVKIVEQLEVGSVNINGASQRSPDLFPFLGVKDSGQGVQGIKEALNSMTRWKGCIFNWKV